MKSIKQSIKKILRKTGMAPVKQPEESHPGQKKPSRSSGKKRKEKHILSVMKKTGWSREEAVSNLKKAAALGISYSFYDKENFHLIPPEEMKAKYDEIIERKARRKERLAQKKDKYAQYVCEQTGWDYEKVIREMDRAKKDSLATPENYAVYRFWELSEEQQKTFFTQGVSSLIRKKYLGGETDLSIFRDKVTCCSIFEPFLGRPWAATESLSFPEYQEKFRNESRIIYKPLTGTGGHGIRVFACRKHSPEDLYGIIKELPPGIIEGFIDQHEVLSQFSKKAVNTIRVVTVMTRQDFEGIEKNKVHVLFAGLRMAAEDSFVDNLHSGGIISDIDLDTGILQTDGADFANNTYITHPDTGATIKGTKIPYFDEVKKLVSEAGKDIEAYLGWDIAISKTGPVLVEINTSPGAVILQVPYIMARKGMRPVVEKYLSAKEIPSV